ncbi:MAG: hypothetical protein ACYSTY_12450 [Planctomycetota bacterium]|jgi:hypothetical protein
MRRHPRQLLSALALFTVLLMAAPAHAQWLYRPVTPGPWSAEPSGVQPHVDDGYAEEQFYLPHPEDPYFGLSIRRHRGAGNGYNFGYGDSVRRFHGLNYSSPYYRGSHGRGIRFHHGFHGRHRFRQGHGFRSRHGLGGGRFHGRSRYR